MGRVPVAPQGDLQVRASHREGRIAVRWIERKRAPKRTQPKPAHRTPAPRAPPAKSALVESKKNWVTGYVPFHLIPKDERPELSEEDLQTVTLSRYQVVIRGPDDPVCSSEQKRQKNLPNASGGDTTPHRRMRKWTVDDCRASITSLLTDGTPRTFNAICVELYDKSSSVAFGETPEDALWSLVVDGVIEQTTAAPFYFRMVQGG